MQPRCPATERDRERLHRHAIVDDSSARLCQGSPFGAADCSRSFAVTRRLWARLVESAQFSDLVRGGISTLRQTRVAGHWGGLRGLAGGADCLAGATEIFGDLIEGLPVVPSPGYLVDVRERLLTPAAEADVVAGDR